MRVWSLSVRAEYEVFDLSDVDDLSMISVGLTYTLFVAFIGLNRTSGNGQTRTSKEQIRSVGHVSSLKRKKY